MNKLNQLTKAIQGKVPNLTNGMKATQVNSQVVEVTADMPVSYPIKLEDVLKTIHLVRRDRYLLDLDGYFLWQSDDTHGTPEEEPQWVLGLPLSQQPQETIDWLHRVICIDI